MKNLINYIEYTGFRAPKINELCLDFEKLNEAILDYGVIELNYPFLAPFINIEYLAYALLSDINTIKEMRFNPKDLLEKVSSNTTDYTYFLQTRIFNETNQEKKEKLRKCYDYFLFLENYDMNLKDFFLKKIVITNKMNTKIFKSIFHKIAVINENLFPKASEIAILEGMKEIQKLVEELFYLMNKNGIYFKNEFLNTYYLQKLLIRGFTINLNGDALFILTPFSFKYADKNIKIKVIEQNEKLILSDNKILVDYLKNELYLNIDKHLNKLHEIIKSYEAELNENEVTMKIANITNPVVMERNFSRFIELLLILSNVEILKD